MTRPLSFFSRLLTSRARGTRRGSPLRRGRRPTVEHLEDRTAPATFTVNTTLDTIDASPGNGVAADSAGRTSLRAAVMEANALPGADVIVIPAALGTCKLTIAGSVENAARTGDL